MILLNFYGSGGIVVNDRMQTSVLLDGAVLRRVFNSRLNHTDNDQISTPTFHTGPGDCLLFMTISGSAQRETENTDGKISISIELDGNEIGKAVAFADSANTPTPLTTFSRSLSGVRSGHHQILVKPDDGTKIRKEMDFFTISILEFAGVLSSSASAGHPSAK